MKQCYTICLLLLTLGSTKAAAEPVAFGVEQDKVLHFSVSALLSAGSIKLFEVTNTAREVSGSQRVMASALTLAAGLAKEINDAQAYRHRFDRGDMTANLLGVITGNILQWEF